MRKKDSVDSEKVVTPDEARVVETWIAEKGNVAASSRATGISRARISRILDRSHVREDLLGKLEKLGLDMQSAADVINEGMLKAYTIVYKKGGKGEGGVLEKVPDFRSRLEYLKLFLGLSKVDTSGRHGEVVGEITELTDEELLAIMGKHEQQK